jgi:DNA-directed RNA polymerase subunit K/omega
MPLKPIDLTYFNRKERNVHECIVATSKRARQINEDNKIEFNQAVEMVATKTETEGEEIDVNPDQLRISLEFEKRRKPTDVAIDELMADKLNWRYKEPEAIVVVKEEEGPAEEEVQEEE